MSEADAVPELLARVDRTQRLLRRIVDEYRAFLEGDFKLMGRKNTSAIVIAEMTLRIEGVREPVIGEETAGWLGELLKFRHFRRYYFELDYDWDKLEYLPTCGIGMS